MNHYDAIVIGQGAVGAALALGLTKLGYRVATVDPCPAPVWDVDKIDLRVFALSGASTSLLDTLGVWAPISAARSSAYSTMTIWDESSNGHLSFTAEEAGYESLGHIVENSLISSALQLALKQQSVEPISSAIVALSQSAEKVNIELESGEQLTASLVFGADGARSAVRELIAVEARGWSYEQKGIVTTIATERHHQNTAWQRFLKTGPLAYLPLSDGRVSIVWSTTQAEASKLLSLDDDAFCQALSNASQGVLGDVLSCDQRAAFPLQLQHVDHYVKGRVVLLGDAAHTIHPLAGQGVNLGFADVSNLLGLLSGKPDLATLRHSILRKYERSRKAENLKMAAATDGLNRLFLADSKPVQSLRGFGLNLVSRIQPLKQRLIREALGIQSNRLR